MLSAEWRREGRCSRPVEGDGGERQLVEWKHNCDVYGEVQELELFEQQWRCSGVINGRDLVRTKEKGNMGVCCAVGLDDLGDAKTDEPGEQEGRKMWRGGTSSQGPGK